MHVVVVCQSKCSPGDKGVGCEHGTHGHQYVVQWFLATPKRLLVDSGWAGGSKQVYYRETARSRLSHHIVTDHRYM